jgi:hypothetical protein
MHPHYLLHAMVNDHHRQLIFDADTFRQARQDRSNGPRPITAIRRAVGTRLIRVGELTIGAPVVPEQA